jgi:mono/diheme cytochrome c family protein
MHATGECGAPRPLHVPNACLSYAIAVVAAAVGPLMPSGSHAQTAAPPAASSAPSGSSSSAEFDVQKLFANTCGWCHSNAGRTAGRGPQLMGTTLTDAEILSRIRNGKTGAMPAFGTAFTDDELRAIVAYIRGLKDDPPK